MSKQTYPLALATMPGLRPRVALDVHPFTDRGRREQQEDYFYTDPPPRRGRPWLGVVSDGMGGHHGGDIASKEGVHALKRAFDAAVASGLPAGEALRRATAEGHRAVLQAAEKARAAGDMGATVVAFAIDGATLHWCSAGDSRLYLWREGRLEQLTRDFTLGEDLRQGLAAGDWTEADIQANPRRNALTSFMGTDAWRCDQGSRALRPGDVLVSCSDGVYGTLAGEGIAAACGGAAGGAQGIAEDLQKRVAAVGKPNQDNSTAVVVCFGARTGTRAGILPGLPAGLAPARSRHALLAVLAGCAAFIVATPLALYYKPWALPAAAQPAAGGSAGAASGAAGVTGSPEVPKEIPAQRHTELSQEIARLRHGIGNPDWPGYAFARVNMLRSEFPDMDASDGKVLVEIQGRAAVELLSADLAQARAKRKEDERRFLLNESVNRHQARVSLLEGDAKQQFEKLISKAREEVKKNPSPAPDRPSARTDGQQKEPKPPSESETLRREPAIRPGKSDKPARDKPAPTAGTPSAEPPASATSPAASAEAVKPGSNGAASTEAADPARKPQ